ncbi:MAG: hypothetical protein ACKOPM_07440 [Novosphingobium sp.]
MRLLANALAGIALLIGAPLHAQAIEEKNVLSGKVKLDPAKGYIYSTGPGRVTGMFIRVPDAEDIEAYRVDWEKEFAKAEKGYDSKLKSWQKDADMAVSTGQKFSKPKPVKPTRETFSIGPIEQRTTVSFGPTFVYSKSKDPDFYSYLNGVKPGTYIWYGPIFVGPNGMAGYCYCMGTIKFEVKAGVITDLGNMLTSQAGLEGLMGFDSVDNQPDRFTDGNPAAGAPGPDSLQYGVPDTLKALPVERAQFHAAGKINNFFGIRIARLRPIAGVLGYKRDAVIDLRTGQQIPVQIVPFKPVEPAADIPDED